MIYNQKQRQLMIWDQRGVRNSMKSLFLLLNLGVRIALRNAFSPGKHYVAHPSSVSFQNEPALNN